MDLKSIQRISPDHSEEPTRNFQAQLPRFFLAESFTEISDTFDHVAFKGAKLLGMSIRDLTIIPHHLLIHLSNICLEIDTIATPVIKIEHTNEQDIILDRKNRKKQTQFFVNEIKNLFTSLARKQYACYLTAKVTNIDDLQEKREDSDLQKRISLSIYLKTPAHLRKQIRIEKLIMERAGLLSIRNEKILSNFWNLIKISSLDERTSFFSLIDHYFEEEVGSFFKNFADNLGSFDPINEHLNLHETLYGYIKEVLESYRSIEFKKGADQIVWDYFCYTFEWKIEVLGQHFLSDLLIYRMNYYGDFENPLRRYKCFSNHLKAYLMYLKKRYNEKYEQLQKRYSSLENQFGESDFANLENKIDLTFNKIRFKILSKETSERDRDLFEKIINMNSRKSFLKELFAKYRPEVVCEYSFHELEEIFGYPLLLAQLTICHYERNHLKQLTDKRDQIANLMKCYRTQYKDQKDIEKREKQLTEEDFLLMTSKTPLEYIFTRIETPLKQLSQIIEMDHGTLLPNPFALFNPINISIYNPREIANHAALLVSNNEKKFKILNSAKQL